MRVRQDLFDQAFRLDFEVRSVCREGTQYELGDSGHPVLIDPLEDLGCASHRQVALRLGGHASPFPLSCATSVSRKFADGNLLLLLKKLIL